MTSSTSGAGEANTDGKPLVPDCFRDEAVLPIRTPVPNDSFAPGQEWKHPLLPPSWKPTCLQGLSVSSGIIPYAFDMWPSLEWDMAAGLL